MESVLIDFQAHLDFDSALLGDFTLASQVRVLLEEKIVCEDNSQVNLGPMQVK